MKQAEDYREEANVLAEVLAPLKDADFQTETLFKGWTINDVIGHLHMFDVAALRTLESTDAFAAFFAPIAAGMQQGKTLLETQYPWLDGLEGEALFAVWHETTGKLANAYATADPKQRVKWAGPDMSALSSITARQMETWAHGHEVFDLLGSSTQLRDDLEENINYFKAGIKEIGLDYRNGDSAIVPVMLYDAKLAQEFANKLLLEGVYAIGFFYPVVPKDLARIRVQLSAAHTKEQLDKALAAFEKVGKELGVI
mgnify:CR=1 FL=1